MVRKVLVIVLALVFVLTGGYVLAQYKYSDATMKMIDELKILSRDKKDMPLTMAGVKMIKGEEIKKMLDEGTKFVLLDNRVPADYEKEHIPGALRLSPDDLLEKGPKAAEAIGLKKDDVIVNYCNGIKCWRSPGAIVILQELGYKNLSWYREGIPDWIKKGFDTVEGKEPGTWKK
jgi:rhodanese-related sulfurtransferase